MTIRDCQGILLAIYAGCPALLEKGGPCGATALNRLKRLQFHDQSPPLFEMHNAEQ